MLDETYLDSTANILAFDETRIPAAAVCVSLEMNAISCLKNRRTKCEESSFPRSLTAIGTVLDMSIMQVDFSRILISNQAGPGSDGDLLG